MCTKYEMRKSMKLKQKCYRSDTASAKFLLGGPGYNMKIVIYWGELIFGGRGRGRDKNLVGEGDFSRWG